MAKLDNRGAQRYGLAFEGAVKHDLGHLEVEDQAAGVQSARAPGALCGRRRGCLRKLLAALVRFW